MKPDSPIQYKGNQLTLFVDGPLDYTTISSYQTALNSFKTESPGSISMQISMTNCSYIDTAGIGFLVKLRKQARDLQKNLVLEDVDPGVMEVLKIVNVVHWFEFQ